MYLFHVHSYRCGHAGSEKDEEYIIKALDMGADTISFSDHAPFPGDPFGSRMKIGQLDEYCSTLSALREKYRERIKVEISLETEYIPMYESYYQDLNASGKFDYLILGQHMCYDGKDYSFAWPSERKNAEEHIGLVKAMIEGIKSGFFRYTAHPDRAFRRLRKWTPEADDLSGRLIEAAVESGITLEKNLSSMEKHNYYRPEFWKLVPDSVPVVWGVDAHATKELERIYRKS
jgi:histidinol-phosphatase (PHP family)